MKVVKTQSIQGELRTKGVRRKGPNELVVAISRLSKDESLIISAKEADKWKSPANVLRTTINFAKDRNFLPKTVKYSVCTLKSGSYAVIRQAN